MSYVDHQEEAKRTEALRAGYANQLAERSLVGAGILIFGPLYLTMVFVAALLVHAVIARNTAILAAGVSYVAFFAQYPPAIPERAAEIAVLASIAAGAFAGFALLIGI